MTLDVISTFGKTRFVWCT